MRQRLHQAESDQAIRHVEDSLPVWARLPAKDGFSLPGREGVCPAELFSHNLDLGYKQADRSNQPIGKQPGGDAITPG